MSVGRTAQEVIARLDLQPHPEGGWYRQTYADEASSLIYYLLEAGDCSEWHRVHDRTEVWHHYAGGPLALTVSPDGHDAESWRLGPDVMGVERPQAVVPAGWWQTAESLGRWTLVGCTVAPAFTFDAFEMAPKGWRPVPRKS